MNKHLTPLIDAYIKYFGQAYNSNVWEVGSRDGNDAVEISLRISRPLAVRSITALEPNPEQAYAIRRDHPEINVIEEAASDVNGTDDFMVYKGDIGAVGSSSLNLEWKKGDLKGEIIRVGIIRLDELVKDGEIIDVMKIDVEGYSLQALKGLGRKIHQVRVFHIEAETWTDSYEAVKSFMFERGFELVAETEEYSGMPDLVYINKAMVL